MLPMRQEAEIILKVSVGSNKLYTFSAFQNELYKKLIEAEAEINKSGELRIHFNVRNDTLIDKLKNKLVGLIK